MKSDSQLLAGQRVLITGGTGDLGQALVRAAHNCGAVVAFTYRGSVEKAQALKNELGTERVFGYQVDLSDARRWTQVFPQIESEIGCVDVLINNSGRTQVLPLAMIDEEDWRLILETNLTLAYRVTRSVLRQMVFRKSGSILNIGSLAGVRMIAGPVHYCASKAAIKGFTESLAKEVGRYNIRVNCLAPGLLTSGVARSIPEKNQSEYLSQTALGRLGEVEEVARLACFMVSQKNSYMTGATVVMDGGL